MKTLRAVQKFARRHGVEISNARLMVRSRRAQIMNTAGVDLLVDVGANRGQYVDEIRFSGYSGRVMSFEPYSAAFDDLLARSDNDQEWSCQRVAVGAAPGQVDLNISTDDYFNSVLPASANAIANHAQAVSALTETVDIARLDDLLADVPGERLALKADVQGYESAVLDGAMETLRRTVVVELELSPTEIYQDQVRMIPMLERLDRLGFQLSLVENAFLQPSTGRALQFNGIFVKEPTA